MISILAFVVGLLALFVIARLLVVPMRIISKLILNGIVGGLTLLLVNLVGGMVGLSIAITPLSAVIAGFFGFPGVIFLLLLQYIA